MNYSALQKSFKECVNFFGLENTDRNNFIRKSHDGERNVLVFKIGGVAIVDLAEHKGGVSWWAAWDEDAKFEDVIDFMIKFNVEPEPIDAGVLANSERATDECKKFFEIRKNHIRFVYDINGGGCIWHFYKHLAVGRELYGHQWVATEGEMFCPKWHGKEIPFSFEKVVKWLIENQYPLKE